MVVLLPKNGRYVCGVGRYKRAHQLQAWGRWTRIVCDARITKVRHDAHQAETALRAELAEAKELVETERVRRVKAEEHLGLEAKMRAEAEAECR